MPILNWIGKEAMTDAQELARRNNEAEAVWRLYQRKRELRRLLGSDSPLPELVLDDLDWQAAEQEGREARALDLPTQSLGACEKRCHVSLNGFCRRSPRRWPAQEPALGKAGMFVVVVSRRPDKPLDGQARAPISQNHLGLPRL